MRTLRSPENTWFAFWPTLTDGTTVLVILNNVAAILPHETGALITLSGGSTLNVIESLEEIERELFQ